MKDKVIGLSKLNEFATMDISKFIQMKYGEGWYLESDFSTSKGSIRIFKDIKGIKYTIEYIRNELGILIPNKILRICGIIVDYNK